MKIVICWSHISGYMAACWRALAATPGVEVFLLGFESDPIAPFDTRLLGNIRHRLLSETDRQNFELTRQIVTGEKPDVMLVSGWFHPAYRKLVADPAVAGATKIMAVDTPFRGDLKQAVGRHLLKPLLKRFDRIVVATERGYTYAKYLGFGESQIRRGIYGIDYAAFATCAEQRLANPAGWPKKFLYVGRYAPEKGMDVLTKAYQQYRANSRDPWELVCCGRGPLAGAVAGWPGVSERGFVPPDQQARVFAECGAFVIASNYEPWGAAIAEAGASGLPLICSNACSSIVDLLRDAYNGYTFATGDVDMLARRMSQLAARSDLPEWGRRSQHYAAAYAGTLWPLRVFDGLLPA
jgi:glycosyltransferase involved in cell wall biosynthesis